MYTGEATIAILNDDRSVSMIYSQGCYDYGYFDTLNSCYSKYHQVVELIHLGNIQELKGFNPNTDIVSFHDRINHKLGVNILSNITIPNLTGYESHIDFNTYEKYVEFIIMSPIEKHYLYDVDKCWYTNLSYNKF